MNIFFWKNNKAIDNFANDLANDLYSQLQPKLITDYYQLINSKDKKVLKTRKKVETQFQNAVTKIQHFRGAHKIGVYGKARLHLKFKERLKELGYDPDAVTKINEMLLLKTP